MPAAAKTRDQVTEEAVSHQSPASTPGTASRSVTLALIHSQAESPRSRAAAISLARRSSQVIDGRILSVRVADDDDRGELAVLRVDDPVGDPLHHAEKLLALDQTGAREDRVEVRLP